jgi:hypothetical protein
MQYVDEYSNKTVTIHTCQVEDDTGNLDRRICHAIKLQWSTEEQRVTLANLAEMLFREAGTTIPLRLVAGITTIVHDDQERSGSPTVTVHFIQEYIQDPAPTPDALWALLHTIRKFVGLDDLNVYFYLVPDPDGCYHRSDRYMGWLDEVIRDDPKQEFYDEEWFTGHAQNWIDKADSELDY